MISRGVSSTALSSLRTRLNLDLSKMCKKTPEPINNPKPGLLPGSSMVLQYLTMASWLAKMQRTRSPNGCCCISLKPLMPERGTSRPAHRLPETFGTIRLEIMRVARVVQTAPSAQFAASPCLSASEALACLRKSPPPAMTDLRGFASHPPSPVQAGWGFDAGPGWL
ncbi:hypothetical protein GALL_520540 [mine drainage metagenome]|uniref:Uncharacterized protein n=1 Tax=mine drainage metagenome TaxID=410659 RepID=A0A1J5P5B8_9ZZZZ